MYLTQSLQETYQKHVKLLEARIFETNQAIQEYKKTINDLCSILCNHKYQSNELFDIFFENDLQQVTNEAITAKEEKKIYIDWMGLVDDFIVIYIKTDEKVKDININCEAIFIINEHLKALIIQINFSLISTLIDIKINFKSGSKAHLSSLKLDLKELCSSDINLNVLQLMSQSVEINLNDQIKECISHLLLLNKLQPKLYLSIVETNTLKVHYLKKEYLQIVDNFFKEIFDSKQCSTLYTKQKINSHLRKSLAEELLYCNKLINGENNYHKMRRNLLKIESNTDLILSGEEFCSPSCFV